jgi:hypothetical protein
MDKNIELIILTQKKQNDFHRSLKHTCGKSIYIWKAVFILTCQSNWGILLRKLKCPEMGVLNSCVSH